MTRDDEENYLNADGWSLTRAEPKSRRKEFTASFSLDNDRVSLTEKMRLIDATAKVACEKQRVIKIRNNSK